MTKSNAGISEMPSQLHNHRRMIVGSSHQDRLPEGWGWPLLCGDAASLVQVPGQQHPMQLDVKCPFGLRVSLHGSIQVPQSLSETTCVCAWRKDGSASTLHPPCIAQHALALKKYAVKNTHVHTPVFPARSKAIYWTTIFQICPRGLKSRRCRQGEPWPPSPESRHSLGVGCFLINILT